MRRHLIIVFDGKGINPILKEWLKGRDVKYASEFGSAFPSIAIWRNRAVKWFLETDFEEVLFIDDDMVPIKETEPFFDNPAPIVGAHYLTPHGHDSHMGEGNVACGFLKISREVLEKIEPPWFDYPLKDDGTAPEVCECAYFVQQAFKAGFHPVKAGLVGHIVEAVVIPSQEGGKCQFEFLRGFTNA